MKRVRTPPLPPDMPALRPIPSAGGLYLAGDDGSIWAAPRFDGQGAWRPAKRVKPKSCGGHAGSARRGRYLCVNLTIGGVTTQRAVHRLVAEAWLPDYHWMKVVHHVDRDPRNNRPENLRCMLRTEHERLHGVSVSDADATLERDLFEEHRDDPPPSRRGKVVGSTRGEERKLRSAARKLKDIGGERDALALKWKELKDGE